jgi:hypothetical protein
MYDDSYYNRSTTDDRSELGQAIGDALGRRLGAVFSGENEDAADE